MDKHILRVIFVFMILIMPIFAITPELGWILSNIMGNRYTDVQIEYNEHMYTLIVHRDTGFGAPFGLSEKGNVLLILGNNENNKIVYNRQMISNILLDYYELSKEDLINDITSLNSSFHTAIVSRDKNSEYLCMQYTGGIGFDGLRLRCYDEEGCLANCRRVEICDRLSFGVGRPFIREIMKFNQIIDGLDGAEMIWNDKIALAESSILAEDSMDGNGVVYNQNTISSLNELISISEKWQKNANELSTLQLSDVYYFCPNMDVDPILLTDLYKKTDTIKSDMNKLLIIRNNQENLVYINSLLFPAPFREWS